MKIKLASVTYTSSVVSVHACKILFSPSVAARGKNGQSRLNRIIASNISAKPPQVNQRRSANYHPSIWSPELIESFTTDYKYDLYAGRLEKLKQEVKKLFSSTKGSYDRLKLIDSLQRLGVAYHFEQEIEEAINLLTKDVSTLKDLNETALSFRLLREHGHSISTDVFDKFRNADGKFSESLEGDITGLLSLYEASFLGSVQEDVLEEAKSFSTKHLNDYLSGKLETNFLTEKLQQSLDIPLYWRMQRNEAQNFIDLYPTDDPKNLALLLELAKLDFNLVQSIHQKELKELARWWRELGFKETLSFSRDRLMENYLWAMGIVFEPQFNKCRIELTKFVCILTAIDDMYDIYGSLNELELFTDAVKRWNIGAMEKLPYYMQICYLAMFNFGNDLAYDVLKNHGLNLLSYIKNEWANLCGSYLVEARWFSGGHKPTLNEYLENAWTSVAGPAAIVHACLLPPKECKLTKHSLINCLKDGYEVIYWSSQITRLSNDLGTSKVEIKRGDVVKSVQCCMNEKGISTEEARDRIQGLLNYSWKKLNENRIAKSNCLPNTLMKMCLNMARTAQCIYQHEDGIGSSNGVTKDRLVSLILSPSLSNNN
ncbi:probable terpene synthase 9 isoform X4 [Citrus clementina]|uniref:probable terpene synthase 9 isoform X4 n=1 Tax=Citrus clementina TaxID=85681 RepID=UPI000CECE5EB|nr:probable terpene synthase 9 isoform X4 [Citrus x clementina]